MASVGMQKQEPSLADIFGQLTELNKPGAVSEVSKMSFGAIDPAILQGAVADGGPLSSAESFANSNAWAMTPETFKTSMQNRPDAMKITGDATTLSDAVFGNRERTKALLEAQGRDTATRNANASSAIRRLGDIEGDRTRRDISANELASREREGAANRAAELKQTKMRIGSAESIAAADRALRRDLARITMSGGYGADAQALAKAGVPFHREEDQAQIMKIIQADPKKVDPVTRYQASIRALGMGMLGVGVPFTIEKPGTGTFGFGKQKETYVIGTDPQTKNKMVYQQVEQDGKKGYKPIMPVSTMLPSKSSAGGGGSSSVPYFMTQGE